MSPYNWDQTYGGHCWLVIRMDWYGVNDYKYYSGGPNGKPHTGLWSLPGNWCMMNIGHRNCLRSSAERADPF